MMSAPSLKVLVSFIELSHNQVPNPFLPFVGPVIRFPCVCSEKHVPTRQLASSLPVQFLPHLTYIYVRVGKAYLKYCIFLFFLTFGAFHFCVAFANLPRRKLPLD
jgi:hypothetical protein